MFCVGAPTELRLAVPVTFPPSPSHARQVMTFQLKMVTELENTYSLNSILTSLMDRTRFVKEAARLMQSRFPPRLFPPKDKLSFLQLYAIVLALASPV